MVEATHQGGSTIRTTARKRRIRGWTVLAAAIAIALAAAANVLSLHFRSDRGREAGLLLDRVEELAIRMRTMQQQVVGRPELAGEMIKSLVDVRYRMTSALDGLGALAPGDLGPRAVRAAFENYIGNFDQLLTAYASGHQENADSLLKQQVEPSYARFLALVADVRQDYGQTASRSNYWAMAGSILVLTLALFFIAALFWSLERTRHTADLLSTERLMMRKHAEQLGAMLQNASDMIAIIGADGRIYYVSPAAQRVTGYAADLLVGHSALDFLHPEDLERCKELFVKLISHPGANYTEELRFMHANESWHTAEVVANNLLDDPAVGGILVTYRDISERKCMEEKLRHLAYHDPLTNLPNRSLFMQRLKDALVEAKIVGRPVAVLFMDMDNFKLINDSLGHQAGDQLLLAAAARLKAVLGPLDLAGHLGGDEFVLLLKDVADASDAYRAAERIRETFRPPFTILGHDLFASVSMGVAISAPGYDTPESLLRAADLAMYTAKSKGKARFEVFDRTMDRRLQHRLEMETDLRKAMERNEFRLYYQPIISLHRGRVAEVEALIRWEHPRRGLVSPADFIPIAEETGLILPIGRWVLHTACQQVREWQVEHPGHPPLMVSVNLSGKQLQDPSLTHEVARALRESGLDPALLKLEITESVMMQDADATASTLKQLKLLGLQLAIDDFGTGYSSLGYLKRFPVDVLKIDRSFVDRLGRDPQESAIVRAIITLAKALNLGVTGEGIETADQLAQLQALGCDLGQGYLFARPVPSLDTAGLVRPHKSLVGEQEPESVIN